MKARRVTLTTKQARAYVASVLATTLDADLQHAAWLVEHPDDSNLELDEFARRRVESAAHFWLRKLLRAANKKD